MPRKRRFDDAEMDITPMIDITFLLLIFFLVASKMDEGATLDAARGEERHRRDDQELGRDLSPGGR